MVWRARIVTRKYQVSQTTHMYYDGIQEVRLSITNHPKCFVIGELQQEGSTVRWREEELSELGCLAGSGGSSKYLVKVHLEELRMSIEKKLQRLFVHVSSLAHSSFSMMRILPMGPKCKSLFKTINIDLYNTKKPMVGWATGRQGSYVRCNQEEGLSTANGMKGGFLR